MRDTNTNNNKIHITKTKTMIIRRAFGPRRVRPRALARVVLFPLIVRVGDPQGPRR